MVLRAAMVLPAIQEATAAMGIPVRQYPEQVMAAVGRQAQEQVLCGKAAQVEREAMAEARTTQEAKAPPAPKVEITMAGQRELLPPMEAVAVPKK